MKKELVLTCVFLGLLIAISLTTSGMKGTVECDYDREFDSDGDYMMAEGADCPAGYQFDCDDSDKDVFKDCDISVWSRLVNWLKGTSEKQTTLITGNAVTNKVTDIIPDAEKAKEHIKRVMTGKSNTDTGSETCSPVTVCVDDRFKEIYCPLSYDECCGRYSDCRVIDCADEFCEDENVDEYYQYADDEYGYEYSDGEDDCTEEYNDCYDGGEAVICKGPFSACASAFDSCTCGTSDDTGEDQLQPEIDSQETIDCDTGVYVCKRQTISMSGDLAESTVTCKESFSRCSMTYGECECGDSSKTDFPTQYIGETGVDSVVDNAQNYWCDYNDRQIPCYMLPENCNKKSNTCRKPSGQWITCEGTFAFCEKQYEECLCGVEILSSGFMVTSAD